MGRVYPFCTMTTRSRLRGAPRILQIGRAPACPTRRSSDRGKVGPLHQGQLELLLPTNGPCVSLLHHDHTEPVEGSHPHLAPTRPGENPNIVLDDLEPRWHRVVLGEHLRCTVRGGSRQ